MLRQAALLLLLAAAGCATAQLDVPAGSWDVTGANPRVWNEPISFGPYRTEKVDEGTTRSFLADLNILSAGRIDQAYRVRLGGIDGDCHMRQLLLGKNDLFVDPSLGRSALLVCGYEGDGGRSVLTMSRTGKTEAWLTGELRSESSSPLEIRSLHKAKGSRIRTDTLGYEILDRGTRVAIVETVNRGRVWIDPAAKNRDRIAAVAATLLLFKDPDLEFME